MGGNQRNGLQRIRQLCDRKTRFAPGGAFFNFSSPTRVSSVEITNATYAALSMQNGDSFSKAFGGPSGSDPDFFRVTFTGYSEPDKEGFVTGSQEFYLADFRFDENSRDYIVDEWQTLELSSLGTVRSVSIGMDSSDVGAFGMNTPAYLAIDNLSITSVPEPGNLALLAIVSVGDFISAPAKSPGQSFMM